MNRVAFVTGGGRGIGAAAARRIAREAITVAVADRDLDAARAVADEVGGLTRGRRRRRAGRRVGWWAFNNAGVTGVRAEVAGYPDDAFWRVQHVNTASGAGVARSSAYVAGKHAIVGLTRTAAVEYADRGIRVNARNRR